jgi:hypothetical protein
MGNITNAFSHFCRLHTSRTLIPSPLSPSVCVCLLLLPLPFCRRCPDQRANLLRCGPSLAGLPVRRRRRRLGASAAAADVAAELVSHQPPV